MAIPAPLELAYEQHVEPELSHRTPGDEPNLVNRLVGVGSVTYATGSEAAENGLSGIVDLSAYRHVWSPPMGRNFRDLNRLGWLGLRARTRVVFTNPELLADLADDPHGADVAATRQSVAANLGTTTSLVLAKPLIVASLAPPGDVRYHAAHLPETLQTLPGSILTVLVLQVVEDQPALVHTIDNRDNAAYQHSIDPAYLTLDEAKEGNETVVEHFRPFIGKQAPEIIGEIGTDFQRASTAFLAQKAVADSATFALSL